MEWASTTVAKQCIDNSVKVRKDRVETSNQTHNEVNKKAEGESLVVSNDNVILVDVLKI